MKLVKITEEHYILVDDAKKAMHTIPTSQAKELLGVVDVEKKALEISPIELDEDDFDVNETHRVTWIDGYSQALEDNKDKKWSDMDLEQILLDFIDFQHPHYEPRGSIVNRFIKTLQPKTEWKVEMVDGKLKIV